MSETFIQHTRGCVFIGLYVISSKKLKCFSYIIVYHCETYFGANERDMTTTTSSSVTTGSDVVLACEKEEEEAIDAKKTKKTTTIHEPGFKLTQEERMEKFYRHRYGVCVSCDSGFDDPSEFMCDPRRPRGFGLMCNPCIDYYNKYGYVSCGYGPFSNAVYNAVFR